MKKPKKPKLPKQPKASSSGSIWQNYYDRVKDKLDDYNKKMSDFMKDGKTREAMKEKVKKLKLKNN